jgi:predicted CXXCH cytochrome family protein
MGVAGCVACHSNHKVASPSEAFLAGADAVCAQCHDAESAGGKLASEMHREITGLDTALDKAGAILSGARRSGMEVSEALLRLNEGRERLVKARVAVHAFRGDAVAAPVKEGLAIAAETQRAGEEALKERDFRRLGLALSLIAILITIAALWLRIREIEAPARGGQESAGR